MLRSLPIQLSSTPGNHPWAPGNHGSFYCLPSFALPECHLFSFCWFSASYFYRDERHWMLFTLVRGFSVLTYWHFGPEKVSVEHFPVHCEEFGYTPDLCTTRESSTPFPCCASCIQILPHVPKDTFLLVSNHCLSRDSNSLIRIHVENNNSTTGWKYKTHVFPWHRKAEVLLYNNHD